MKRSKPSTAILDPIDFPFSKAEVFAAYHRTRSIRESKELAQRVARGIRMQRWSERAAAWAQARGSNDPKEINPWATALPSDVYAALAMLSTSARERLEAVRQRHRDKRHLHRVYNEAFEMFGQLSDPLPPEALAAVLAQYEREDVAWREGLAALERRARPRRGDAVT